MPFSEISRTGPGGQESESPGDYERERTERRKQEALTYFIETGRAKTPEAAERYLESLNHLKERVIAVLREAIPSTRNFGEYPYLYSVNPSAAGEATPLDQPIDGVLRPEQLDRQDPRLWSFRVSVAPAA